MRAGTRTGAAIVAAGVAAVAGSAPAVVARTRSSTSCATRGSDVYAAAGRARLYEVRKVALAVCRPGYRASLGVDLRQAPEPDGPDNGDTTIVAARLQPSFAAWGRRVDFPNYGMYTIEVQALTGSHQHRTIPTGQLGPPRPGYGKYIGVGPPVQVKLTAAGDVAWITLVNSIQGLSTSGLERGVEVWCARHGAPAHRLAAGTAINLVALRLSGNAVTWRDHGQAQTAACPT